MPSNPLWEYSLKLYELPHVANFCLGLQDGRNSAVDASTQVNKPSKGANVNILLFCCWAGGQGLILTRDDFDDLESTIEEWHTNTVLPLQSQRRVIGISEQQKQNLLARELAAELSEQDMLFNWFEHRHKYPSNKSTAYDGQSTFSNVRHNITSYCEHLSLHVNIDNPLQRAAQNIALRGDDWRA